MNTKKCIILAAAGVAVAAISARAISEVMKPFRTTGFFIGVTQGTDDVTSRPQYDRVDLAGRNLVNIAMGRSPTDNSVSNQVLVMNFSCDLTEASLSVYDRSASNLVATIAQSTSIDSVKSQDTNAAGPNRARFVGQFEIQSGGSVSNSLLGGFLTIAGQLRLDPQTGCPEPVLVKLDRDSLDTSVGNVEVSGKKDPDSAKLTLRTGLAHLIGVVDAVTNGKTNTILIPFGHLSIRRDVPVTLD
jgi:hypothetical protein